MIERMLWLVLIAKPGCVISQLTARAIHWDVVHDESKYHKYNNTCHDAVSANAK